MIKEYAGQVLGVNGRFHNAWTWDNKRWSTQTWVSEDRKIEGYGKGGVMHVELRFDDNCKNGHNTFAITASVYTAESRSRRDIAAGGCLHEDIALVFPELAPLIAWHLCSTDGPMHYAENTVYLAGDRDHHKLRKGERRQIVNGRSKLPAWRLAYVDSAGDEVQKPEQYLDSAEQPPCGVRLAYLPWETIGEGKERQLDAARNCAIWPEATEEQLSAEPEALKAMLLARLPGLLAEFKLAIVSTGFRWSPSE